MPKIKINADTVLELFRAFNAERDIAVGVLGSPGVPEQRARFYDFKLHAKLRAKVIEAGEIYKAGDFENADEMMRECLKWLDGSQRKYCAGSIEARFMPAILALPHLDDDIEKKIVKLKDRFAKVAETVGKGGGNLDEAGNLFWELKDAIFRAPGEQREREAKRAEAKAKGRLTARQKRWDEEAERSRQLQKAARQQEAAKRSSFIDELVGSL